MNTKQLIQDFVGRFAYELHRKEKPFEPFIEDVAIAGVKFRFWVGPPSDSNGTNLKGTHAWPSLKKRAASFVLETASSISELITVLK